ncbi:MAG TPA: DUF4352 domain-containing protein [Ktedonobacteraceae bacterium]|nr:DUF4352 domain-containing protein [Ktedonobacteraceae bacterium]
MQYPPNPPDPYQSSPSSPSYPSYPPAQQPPPPPSGGYQPTTDPYAPPPSGPYAPTQPASGSYPYTYPPQQMPPQYGGPYQPMQQPPRKGRGWLWITISVVVALILIGGVIAAVSAANKPAQQANGTPTAQAGQATQAATQPGQTQPTAAPTQSSSSSGMHKVGDVVTIGGWQITVNGVKTSQGDEFNQPHAGNTFLLVDVTAVNQTGQAQTFSSLISFTLKDSTGQKYDETIDTAAPSSPDGNVAAGGKLRGTLAYEVPLSQHSFELDFTPDFTSTDVATWSLSV